MSGTERAADLVPTTVGAIMDEPFALDDCYLAALARGWETAHADEVCRTLG